jgi:hypothetical protein
MNQIEELKKAHEDLGKKIQELEKTIPKPDDQYTWEKCFSGEGWWIFDDGKIIFNRGLSVSVETIDVAHSEKVAKKMLATAQLSHIIAKANENWVADWSDIGESKYVIERMDTEVVCSQYSSHYMFLAFKTSEIAFAVYEQNERLIRDYFMMD